MWINEYMKKPVIALREPDSLSTHGRRATFIIEQFHQIVNWIY